MVSGKHEKGDLVRVKTLGYYGIYLGQLEDGGLAVNTGNGLTMSLNEEDLEPVALPKSGQTANFKTLFTTSWEVLTQTLEWYANPSNAADEPTDAGARAQGALDFINAAQLPERTPFDARYMTEQLRKHAKG